MNRRQIPTWRDFGQRHAFGLWLAAASAVVFVTLGIAWLLTATMGPLS
ncbi:hypothetical protein [Nocardia vaccinii]|nr:hypothetical protein [Nocardia vaccinii]